MIVDACQAEAIMDDPKVRAIRKWMEALSRRARTSYLMAAPGRPAPEVSSCEAWTVHLRPASRHAGPI